MEEVDLGIQRGEVLSRKDPWQMSSSMIMGEWVDGGVFEYPTGYGDLHQMQIQKKCSFFYTV